MKHYNFLTFLVITFCLATLLNGQSAYEAPTSNLKLGQFKIKKFDFSIGYDYDMVTGIDADYFIAQMPEVQQAVLADYDFSPEWFDTAICENPSINVGFTLVHPSYQNLEWRAALSYKPNRVDGVRYNSPSPNGQQESYLTINGTHSELAVENALIYKLPVLSFFNLYGGIGTNIGVTSASNICIRSSLDLSGQNISYTTVEENSNQVPAGQFGSGDGYDYDYFSDCIDSGSHLNQRVFLQIGSGLKFGQRIEVGMDIKYGYGYRTNLSGFVAGTNLIATNINLRYILR